MSIEKFYVPKEKQAVTRDFVSMCRDMGLNYSNLLLSFMERFVDENTCGNCNGTGEVEFREECGRTASYCCGGCYESGSCPECN